MKTFFLCITIIVFLFLSCSQIKQGGLLKIPVDIHQNSPIFLSEIAGEITAIELESTDESLLNPDCIINVIVSENEVFIASMEKIYVFNKEGKFIRTIGSIGQGPGEYLGIVKFTLDEKNRRLFISSGSKIISYDWTGNFLEETPVLPIGIPDINYINEKLLLVVNKTIADSTKVFSHSAIWSLNNDLKIVDSCTIREFSLKGVLGSIRGNSDFILKGSESIYLYYGDFFTDFGTNTMANKVLRDTLYRFENNRLIPDLKLKFKNDSKFIHLFNMYRSSRYIFAVYINHNNKGKIYFFCYDTKTGKGYNTQGWNGKGFTDDINQIKEPVSIRPFNSDTEMFYYLHTNMKPDDKEEPNPTLYIGKFKK